MEKRPYVKEMTEIEELKYQYDKAVRNKDNLEKNFARRKKLHLLDDVTEREILDEMRKTTEEVSFLGRKMRSMESQQLRSSITEGKLDLGKKNKFFE